MPRKLRELRADLRRARCREMSGKGDHEKWYHPALAHPVVLAGKDGADAKPYQERAVRDALTRIREYKP